MIPTGEAVQPEATVIASGAASPPDRPTLLVDANNLAMRSWYGSRGTGMVHAGVETGSLQLFVNTLAMQVQRWHPDAVGVCWDTAGVPTFRHEIYPEYKGTRVQHEPSEDAARNDLFALIRRFLELAGVPQVQAPGWEADDLIAAVWRTHDVPKVILSNDKDLLQLLADRQTVVVRLSSANAATDDWTHERFVETNGYAPSQIPLMMALTGDTSDNIPGIRGIGPVKAKKLLSAHDWSLRKIIAARPDDAATIELGLALVELIYPPRSPVLAGPVPPFNPTSPGDNLWPDLLDFLDEYAMRSIGARLETGRLWTAGVDHFK